MERVSYQNLIMEFLPQIGSLKLGHCMRDHVINSGTTEICNGHTGQHSLTANVIAMPRQTRLH